MAALYVIEERNGRQVGLARSGLSKSEAERFCAALARAYPEMRYTVAPQRMTGRGKNRRVIYPVPA